MNANHLRAARPFSACLVAALLVAGAMPVEATQYALTTLVNFNATTGDTPVGNVILDASGNLYSTTGIDGPNGGGTVFQYNPTTQSLTTIAAFGPGGGPQVPWRGVVFGPGGDLYGTTGFGGTNSPASGTVYKVDPTIGTVTTLHSFDGSTSATTQATLAFDSSGNIYGTTPYNYTNSGGTTVFEINAVTGAYTVLVPSSAGLAHCQSGVILDSSGNLYGTSYAGTGSIFEINGSTHAVTTIATFPGTNNIGENVVGVNPYGAMTIGPDGNFYGTAGNGGPTGDGTVFELNATTHVLSQVAAFNNTNGSGPYGSVVFDAQGNMFGTTQFGGVYGDGTAWEIAAGTHAITLLATFNDTNGAEPSAALAIGPNGALYGTASVGGDSDLGTLFELTPTPEPSTWVLFAIGATALAAWPAKEAALLTHCGRIRC